MLSSTGQKALELLKQWAVATRELETVACSDDDVASAAALDRCTRLEMELIEVAEGLA